MYEEHSTYSSYQFLLSLIKAVPFLIREIQTDNSFEFTNALKSTKGRKTIFEKALETLGIIYHRIMVAHHSTTEK